ncbi:MAG: UDP-N-acetylmuramate--L-alanine ligase [bacterium]|nr:UDP-N-acetylmuramate--L-alanine ligase [bacterium]
MKLDLAQLKTAFLIGIKGVGMASLAYILSDLNLTVVGSDTSESFVTQPLLRRRAFPIHTSFDPDIVKQENPDIVITTGAHQGTKNPQFQMAKKQNIPAITHAQALGWLMSLKPTGISIAGVGGKTTITSLISHIFSQAGLDPSYLIGAGSIQPLTWPGRWGGGKHFIAEADEYATCPQTDHKPRFSWQSPRYLILTNIEYDHPDIYTDINHTLTTFTDFAHKTLAQGGHLISFIDNPNNQTVVNNLKKQGFKNILTYGFSPQANWQITNPVFKHPFSSAVLTNHKQSCNLRIKLPGRHSLLNAAAAFIAADLNNIAKPQILKHLLSFEYVQRRFQYLGRHNHTLIYDDYAHHPQEVKTSLTAARQWFPKKTIAVVFQSHTISRTQALLDDFSQALTAADLVFITPIFTSAREKNSSVDYQHLLYQKTSHLKPGTVFKLNSPAQLASLTTKLQPDILITMGAGDVYKWTNQLKLQTK